METRINFCVYIVGMTDGQFMEGNEEREDPYLYTIVNHHRLVFRWDINQGVTLSA